MSETEQFTRTLKDFLDLPMGREEWAKYMLAYEKSQARRDPRYTEEETLELYRLQYDQTTNSKRLEREQITKIQFLEEEERLNSLIRAINIASHNRRTQHTN